MYFLKSKIRFPRRDLKTKFLRSHLGFTLIELLFSIGILAVISLIGVWYFSAGTSRQALDKDRQGLVALLSEGRSLALSSKDAVTYGVHLEEFRAVLFKGSTYSSAASDNISYDFNHLVHSPSHSLTLGGDEVVFSRLKGEVSNFGTVSLSLINDALSSTTVTIKNTGVIE